MRKYVLYEEDGRLATITLNRPSRRNGLTVEMIRELYDTLNELAEDDHIGAVLLTGAGHAFSVGADLRAFASPEKQKAIRREYMDIPAILYEIPKITIAAINGPCAGAALALACACDLRYASKRAVFNTAFLDLALSGDWASAWLLHRIVGPAKAKELFYTARKFDSAEAERIGLVITSFPEESFSDSVRSIARDISNAAPKALENMKRNFSAAEELPIRDFIELETRRQSQLVGSKESRDAFEAFFERKHEVSKGDDVLG